MLSIINENKLLTMSHKQIAELVGSRPDKVKQSMERLAERLIIKLTPLGEVNHLGQSVTNYYVDERDSYIVVAQLSPEFTAFLVDEWQKRKNPVLTIEQQTLMIATQLIETTKQRDEAIRTKAHINDKRTATVMGKLGAATKKISKLESQLQGVGDHISLLAAMLPQRIDTEFKSNVQTWRVLKQISTSLKHDIIKAKDPRYGEVNTYHIDVIEAFKTEYL